MMLRQPRILFYAENMVVGGAERYARDLIRGFVERDYEVRIGCNPAPPLLEYMRAISPKVAVDALPVLTIQSSAAFRFGQKTGAGRDPRFDRLRSTVNAAVRLAHLGPDAVVIRRWLKQHQPDVFHINNGGYPGGESCRAAGVAGRLAHVPLVSMAIHGIAGPRRWPPLEDGGMDRLTSRCLDTVIAVSQASAETLVYRRGFPRSQITCIPNGIAIPPPSTCPMVKTRCGLGLPPQGLLIGVVGRLDPNKGQNYLLEAVAVLRRVMQDVHVVIVGSGPSEDAYRGLAERLDIADCVTFTGQRHDVMDIMRVLDVFVLTSVEYESLPYVVLEAMSVGAPIVATHVGGVGEAIQDGQTGLLVAPRDVQALAASLCRLLRDPAERQRLGRAARARAEERFTIEQMVDRTCEHYERLLVGSHTDPMRGV